MKIKLALLFSFVSYLLQAQSTSPDVVATNGDYFSNANYSVDWTLGEIMGETFSSANNFLTQGFHQPKLLLTAFENISSSISISIYPNPTSTSIIIEMKDSSPIVMGMKLQMYDVRGNMILESPIVNSKSIIDLRILANGMYVANIINSENNTKQSYKITKSE